MNPEPIILSHAAHAASPGPMSARRLDGAACDAAYVAALERDLETYKGMFADNYGALMMIRASHGWQLLCRYYRLRDRLLPAGSRRWRIAKHLFDGARRVARGVWRTARWIGAGALPDLYAYWIQRNEPGPDQLARQRAARFPQPVKISIVTPTYETPAAFLKAMLQSVCEQSYADWELCIADGGSRSAEVRAVLETEARRDPRVRVAFLPRNEGIAGNSAAALALATGDYVAFLDHDDLLAPFALYEVARAINQDPDADVLYSDEDKIDSAGVRRSEPRFKPDWSPDVLRCHNYICHLEQVGGLRPGFDGAQDYDLILRASERAKKIVHIPKILYHWRMHGGSTAQRAGAKSYTNEPGRRALQEHLTRQGIEGVVADSPHPNLFQTTYKLTRRPLVSLIVATRDQAAMLTRCLDSVARSGYDRREILLVENNSKEPATFACYEQLAGRPDVRLLTWDRPFNYAALNNWAAAQAHGEMLVFLNNDVEAITPDWIERMLEHAQRPEVGAVGAKLYYPDDTIQHGGVVLGVGGGVAGHAFGRYPRAATGYDCRLISLQNLSAVTAACMMMRKDVFEEVGGFDEGFVLAYNDIDLCLRVRRAGYLIVWTPLAELYHHESATRGYDDRPEKQARFQSEIRRFLMKWGDQLWKGDPYYNPNLSLEGADFSFRF
jgi:O-antigen biosynthesis protein